MRRKLSIKLACKRATLAETDAWTQLLRTYVRDLLSFEVDARGDGTHTLQQSNNIRAALQILQTSARALLRYTHWLLLILTNTRLRG